MAAGNFTVSPIRKFYISGLAQGTSYHILYYAPDSIITQQQTDSLLNAIDNSLSLYKSGSLINRFNKEALGVKTDLFLHTVVAKSLEIWKSTAGLFDITVQPMVSAWGFGPSPSARIPDSSYLAEIRSCVSSSYLHLRKDSLVKEKPCVSIDVNGIAQGYSVDVVADWMEEQGINNYLVEIGGEIRVKGRKQPNNETLRVGIEAPASNGFEEPVIQKIIPMSDGAITTSGNYRKYTEKNGKRFSHLIDPFSGYPFSNELISVTVKAANAITADGYDNALMGMGLKKAMLFLRNHPEMEAYFIFKDKSGSVKDTSTAGFDLAP